MQSDCPHLCHKQSAFQTCHHGVIKAGSGLSSIVYVASADAVGLASAASSRLQGAEVVNSCDLIPAGFAHAKTLGFEFAYMTKDTSLNQQLTDMPGELLVDCTADTVCFEARSHGHEGNKQEAPATGLDSLIKVIQVA